MDAFGLVVSFAGIAPPYFWDSMDWREFLAIGKAYRLDWEKTRLMITAMGGEIKLPWDGQESEDGSRKSGAGKKYSKSKAISVAKALTAIHSKN